MESSIEKLQDRICSLEDKVSALHERINIDKHYDNEESIEISKSLGKLACRMSNLELITTLTAAGLTVHCLGNILTRLGI